MESKAVSFIAQKIKTKKTPAGHPAYRGFIVIRRGEKWTSAAGLLCCGEESTQKSLTPGL